MQTTKLLDDYAPTRDIVDTATAAGHFSVLLNAMKAAQVTETLRGHGPYTLFAPTDAAFRKVTRDTINSLLKDRAKLAGILNAHVVRGKIMAKQLASGPLPTLQGQDLLLIVSLDGVRVGNARIMKTDIEAANGVIHSIDTVLMPLP